MSCLGPLGAKFTLLSPEKNNFVRSSRYCARFIHSSPETDAEGVAELLRLEIGVGVPMLLPVTTKGFEFVEEHRQILSSRFRIPPMAALEDLKLASNKARLHELCLQRGLPVLPSLVLNESVIADLANGTLPFRFPALVKPSRREGGAGIQKVDSAEELAALFQRTPEIAQDHPLLQRFVDGDDFSLSVYCEQGEVKAHTLWQQIVPSSVPYTIPTCIQFVEHPQALEIGKRLLRALRWEGVCDIDLLVDRRSGEVWILEVNARFWGNILSCSQAGVNFPLLAIQAAICQPRVWPTQIDQAVFCFAKAGLRGFRQPRARGCLLRHPLRSTALETSVRDFGPVLRRLQAKLQRLWAQRRPAKVGARAAGKSDDRFGGRISPAS
ncbi:MAG TPA: ATP-grasp domain-containing protein [Opitutus sp.]|nr:ATP-grasp domain-containing protein [Opitutus sp.]